MINYPTRGRKTNQEKETATNKRNRRSFSSANRGMSLEADINASNQYYEDNNIAYIYKRPTPVKVLKCDYSRGGKITDGYFEAKSTTDYNGVWHGKYLDFEAKSTQSKTSFPLHNISPHQIEHLKKVKSAGGIAFYLVEFTSLHEVYMIDSAILIDTILEGQRKSIKYEDVKEKGVLVKQSLHPRLDYLKAVEQYYFEVK